MNKQKTLPEFFLPPEVQAELNAGIQQFFNGDSIEKVRADLKLLQDITITESYGDLDKEDKWLMIDFFRRLNNLIEHLQLVHLNSAIPASEATTA